MTLDKHRHDLGDDRLSVAVGKGFGFTHEECAEFAGVSISTVRRWDAAPQDQAFKAVVLKVSAGLSIYKSRKITDAVSTVVGTAEERIARFFDRAFRLSERLLKKAEEAGDNIKMSDLLVLHKEMTKWAAPFAASEAPKRLEVKTDHTETHVIAEETMSRLENFMTKHEAYLRQDFDGRDDQLPS